MLLKTRHILEKNRHLEPFALLALECFWARRSLRRGLLVGLMVALQGLASVYLGVITATAVSVAMVLASPLFWVHHAVFLAIPFLVLVRRLGGSWEWGASARPS